MGQKKQLVIVRDNVSCLCGFILSISTYSELAMFCCLPDVHHGWLNSLKDIAKKEVSKQLFVNTDNQYSYNTMTTKE